MHQWPGNRNPPSAPLDEQQLTAARIEELTHRIEELRRLHEEAGQEIAAMSGAGEGVSR